MSELALTEAVPLGHAMVARLAADHDVRVLFIKGPVAAAQGLRRPHSSVDVDVLVDPDRRTMLVAALNELGWVDEHPYTSPTVLPMHSLSFRHGKWPLELDLHDRFPGLFAEPQAAFERLWARRTKVRVAASEVPCPDDAGHGLIVALNALRDPHLPLKASELEFLVARIRCTFSERQLRDLAELANDLGAPDTAQPFLKACGAPSIGIGTTARDDLRGWLLVTRPTDTTAVSWVEELRRLPVRSWPRYLWYAAWLTEIELRLADPNMPPGRLPLAGARVRRLRRGLRALPAALRNVHSIAPGPDRTRLPPDVRPRVPWSR